MIRSKFADDIISWVLADNSEGWVISQQGNNYSFEPLETTPEPHQWTINPDEETEEYVADNIGLMHTLNGVPMGLHLEGRRPVMDVQTASVASAQNRKLTDGGTLSNDAQLSLEDIQQRLVVGRVQTREGPHTIVNPFHDEDDEPDIVDLRSTMRLLKNAADSRTPVKAAKNAVEAERAVQGMDWGNAAQIGGLIAAFLMGAITVEYIAGSSAGGGSGIDVGLMTDIAMTVMTLL